MAVSTGHHRAVRREGILSVPIYCAYPLGGSSAASAAGALGMGLRGSLTLAPPPGPRGPERCRRPARAWRRSSSMICSSQSGVWTGRLRTLNHVPKPRSLTLFLPEKCSCRPGVGLSCRKVEAAR